MHIKEVHTRKIKDSRGEFTIEVSVNGCHASSPSGKSKGKYETPSYHKSIDWNLHAIKSLKLDFPINSFSDLKKVELQVKKQFKFKDVKQFGANALFALESAILKALAKSQGKELWQIINEKAKRLPVPAGNAIGGGLHSHNKEHPSFQEFLLIPKYSSIEKNVQAMDKVYNKLRQQLKSHTINDEGALETDKNEEQILEILSKFKEVRVGADVASSSLLCDKDYQYRNKSLNRIAQIHFINSLIQKYNLFYVEDPLDEEDFPGFAKIKKRNLVVGDDLTVTHLGRLKKAVKSKSINAIIIKPNQNGSLLEVQEIFAFCRKHKIKTILSHRSGETMDDALADYAFGFQADFIKCGVATPWRKCKLNRLIEIERLLR